MRDADEQDRLLRAKINGETATAPWRELQRFFAQGSTVHVDESLDLVEVALSMSRDDAERIKGWMADGKVALVSDQQARDWIARDAVFWTLVVKPWVLVQEMATDGEGGPGP